MLIQVNYTDNRFDYVKDNLLDHLIKSKEIKGFRRASGWVTVGIDPLRRFQRSSKQKQAIENNSIVQVEYYDNSYDYITGKMLDSLLDSNKVAKFKRTSGWVTVGVDSMRKAKRQNTYLYPNELRERVLSLIS
jgi:hypothetical protein